MTDPTNTIVLQFIREELGAVRTSMHEELSGLRADISNLADKLGSHVTDTSARVAVLEHRLNEADSEIDELKSARKTSAATRLAISLAVFSVIASPVAALLIK